MKPFRIALIVLVVASVAALVASFVAERSYASQAKLVQRVLVDQAAFELFGETGTPIGEPELMIITDSKAFLGKKTDEGADIVSEQYLKDHHVYPLQLKTVRYVAGLVRIASLVVLVLAAAGLLFIARRHSTVLDDRQLDGIHSARN